MVVVEKAIHLVSHRNANRDCKEENGGKKGGGSANRAHKGIL